MSQAWLPKSVVTFDNIGERVFTSRRSMKNAECTVDLVMLKKRRAKKWKHSFYNSEIGLSEEDILFIDCKVRRDR